MDSIAHFIIETAGQKDRDVISKQHGDVMPFSCHSEKMLWIYLYYNQCVSCIVWCTCTWSHYTGMLGGQVVKLKAL